MNRSRWVVTLAIAAVQLAGCATAPTVDVEDWYLGSAKEAFAEEREKSARDYESEGSLRLALNEWLAISAVFPEAAKPQAEIERLRRVISSKVVNHRRAAASALAKGGYAEARLHYLRALALQPDDRAAITALKKLEVSAGYDRLASAPKISDNAQAYQAPTTSSNKKLGIEIVDPKRSSESVSTLRAKRAVPADGAGGEANLQLALRYLSELRYDAALSHFLMARKHNEAPEEVLNRHIANLHRVLAKRHYDNGVSAFRMASYDLAVAEFKKALEYDPQHQKARLYLASASEMRLRLAPSP